MFADICLNSIAAVVVVFQAAIFELLEQQIQLAFSFCNVLKPEIGVWPRQAIKGLMMMRIAKSDLTHTLHSLPRRQGLLLQDPLTALMSGHRKFDYEILLG